MAGEEEEMCEEDLAALFAVATSSDNTLRIAKEIGFNISPFIGVKKKKTQIQAELAIINAALIIFAVNQVVDEDKARPVIDEFLEKTIMLNELAHRDKGFSKKYPERLAQYFGILSKERPELGLSFSFMTHLGINPIENLKGQLLFTAHVSAVLKEAMAIVAKENNSEPTSPWLAEKEEKETLEAEPDSVRLKEAVALFERGDTKAATREFKEVAKQGNITAQAVLGMIYEQGKGVSANQHEAAKWHLMAAEQGHTKSQASLSLMYLEGRGVPRDPVNAYLWRSLVDASMEGKAAPALLRKAQKLREEDLKNMTPAQAVKAQEMFENWKPKVDSQRKSKSRRVGRDIYKERKSD